LQANAKKIGGTDLSVVHQRYGWGICFIGDELISNIKGEKRID